MHLNSPDTTMHLNISDAEHNLDNLFPYIEGSTHTEEIFKMNLIKVNNDGSLIINHTDNDNPHLNGGYGPFTISQMNGNFKNISVEILDK